MELVLAILGGFAGWSFLRMLLPFRISDRLAPVAIAACAYGILSIPSLKGQIAIAAVSGVLVLHRALVQWLGMELPGPWRLPRLSVHRPARKQAEPEELATGRGYRPGGQPGRRIPSI